MTQREKFLAIAVGILVIGGILWTGIDNYRTAVTQRTKQIASLETEKVQLTEQVTQGFIAERQMIEYQLRSLPSDADQAKSDYQQWLFDIGLENNIEGLNVDPTTTLPISGLYQRLGFRVSGKGDMPGLLNLLHQFYAKDYLHRIRELNIRKIRSETKLTLEMSVDAIALNTAPADAEPPTGTSWRVDGDVAAYHDPIMNRNFFAPPNNAPTYGGKTTINAYAGRESPAQLAFTDKEGHRMVYAIRGDVPEFVRLDPRSGTLRVNSDKLHEFEITVQATDDGFPSRTTEQKLTVKVGPPPEPEARPAPKLQFDDATQTVLTGLVHGRDDWTAWMHVRTRDKTLKLRVEDEFEIGSLKGKVIEVTPKFVVLEIDGNRFELKPNGNLKDAATRAVD